jgi:hypothetical protein
MEHSHENNNKLTPKFFFLSLGVLISLITSVTSFLNLVFETLNNNFPDALNAIYQYGYNSYNYEGIRTSIATLIIFFPVFLVLSYFWRKTIKGGLSRIDDIIRKWMIYLILFLSALVTMIDLVMLVRYFVSGEITTRFILKVAVALVTAVLVGSYYIYQNRKKGLTRSWSVVYAIAAAVLVVLSIIWSFSVIGSPTKQRAYRFDDKRVSDLQNIQWQVISYWQQKESLPKELSDLSNPISNYSVPVDPEFAKGLVYEYNQTAKMSFELCATFSLPMPQGFHDIGSYGGGVIPMANPTMDVAVSSNPYGQSDSWDHQSGRTCFERTIDPDLYPPFPKSL